MPWCAPSGPDSAHQGTLQRHGHISAASRRLQNILHPAEGHVAHARKPIPRQSAETFGAVLCCIDNDVYNISYTKNPFHAKHNDIIFLVIYVDGRQVPAKPLQPNFAEGRYVSSYANLFTSTDKMAQDEGNGLIHADFGDGYTFFGFDLSPDACDGSCFRRRAICASRSILLRHSRRP